MIKRLFILLYTVHCSLFTAIAQLYLPINNSVNDIIESQLIQKGAGFHFSVRPYRLSEINSYVNTDSVYQSLNLDSKSALIKGIFNEHSVGNNGKHEDHITIGLNLLCEGGYDLNNYEQTLQTGAGLNASGDIGKRISFSASFALNNSAYFNYIDSAIKVTNVIPGEGKAINSNLGYFYRYLTFYLTYTPSKYFVFEAGKGKNFFGDGYRSLLLSDNANSYPYFKITTSFKNIKYVNLFVNLRNLDAPKLGVEGFRDRYAAMHYLSWNIFRWLNASLFEAVMFRGTDTLGNKRGFDINYINPVVFYRPVEYSLGSPDNVIMGANVDVRLNRKNLVYFQLMLDEFKIEHVRKQDGWWANKQAFQVGLKSFDIFRIPNLNFQTEYNYIRPFTYTHFDIAQNYSNYNQPLAHPLGANVKELVSSLSYRIKRFRFQMKYNYEVYGSDTGKSNYGQNIFKSYISRTRELGNTTGQGIKNILQYKELNVSYTLNPQANLIIEAGIINRNHKIADAKNNNTFIYLGIRTLLDNQYFDF